ncbi:unnamed protein product [Paramecium sonneborni]|uniref:Armadillo-type fold n=1 Tax=Paramecium sonneborni TaxID=65129 RepID=A0A8S1RTS2_9CILI|nr:unnamed protein product [Paramecium sonneborni]
MDVKQILNDIAEYGEVTKSHIHNLHANFIGDSKKFTNQLEQCYLQLIKKCNGTSKQCRVLFETLTEQFVGFMIKKWKQSLKQPHLNHKQSENTRKFIVYMVKLFVEGVNSQNYYTRIFCGRHLFMILHNIPGKFYNKLLDEKLSYELLNTTVGLFLKRRNKDVGRTQKGLAIKLGSYLQNITWEEGKSKQLKQGIQALEIQMVKTILEEEKNELRLDALINTEVNEFTLQYILMRLRDTDVNIRLQIFTKLMKNDINIQQLNILDRYQVIYDGLRGSNNEKVIESCKFYIQHSFQQLINQSEKQKQNKGIGQIVRNFLNLFEIEKTLIFPQLYSTIQDVLKILIESSHQENLLIYFRDTLKNLSYKTSGAEMTLIKVICQMSKNSQEQIKLMSQMNQIIEQNYPSWKQIVEILNQDLDLLQYNELFQIAQLQLQFQTVLEQTDQNILLEQMIKFISEQKQLECPRIQSQIYNDIYEFKTNQEIEFQWFAQNSNQIQIVKSWYELLIPAIKVMRFLVQSQDHLIELILNVFQKLQKQNVMDKIQSLDKIIKEKGDQREKLRNERIQLMKQKKYDHKTLQLNESYSKQLEQSLLQIFSELDQLNEFNQQIDLHSLYLLDALITQLDFDKVEDRTFIKLKNIIVQINNNYVLYENCLAKRLSYRCLAYIPLFGMNIDGSVIPKFAKFLQNPYELKQYDPVIVIIALRSILDSFSVYHEDLIWVYDQEQYEKWKIMQIIMNYVFKYSAIVQLTAIKGLGSLLINNKLQNPQVWIAQLLFVWFDSKFRKQNENLERMNCIIKLYINTSAQSLYTFEKALEIYFGICLSMIKDQSSILNPQIMSNQKWLDNSLIQIATNSIKFISYKPINEKQILEFKNDIDSNQIKSNFIGPQERLIIFLCKSFTDENKVILQQLIRLVIKQTDFLEMYSTIPNEQNKINLNPSFYQCVIQTLEEYICQLQHSNLDTKEEIIFINVLKDEVATKGFDDGQQLKQSLIQDFYMQIIDINNLIKELKNNSIIIQGHYHKEEDYKDELKSTSEELKKRKKVSLSKLETTFRETDNFKKRQ